MPLIELTTTKSAMAGMNNGTVFADLSLTSKPLIQIQPK